VRNTRTIFRREFTGYFHSPVGYIYLIAFLFLTNLLGLFSPLSPFFYYPTADMRSYFTALAGVSTVFVAAITMRLWAEERKENTFEMLLTFPMRAHELVLGKFLAGLLFYALGLVGSLTVPLMMVLTSRGAEGTLVAAGGAFGLLDMGPVLAGYLGALLLGAVLLAFGLFVSGFCRDQIVAFAITAPVLFFAFILGHPVIQTLLNSGLEPLGENLGTAVGRFIGIYNHFANLTRGVVEGADILFFLVWIAVFLSLNALGIEGRNRPGSRLNYGLAVVLLVACGLAANWVLLGVSLGRADVTEDGLYTISDDSAEILGTLEDRVTVRYFVSRSDRMPPELQNLEQDVVEKLRALREASGGRIELEIFNSLEPSKALSGGLETGADAPEAEEEGELSLEERILDRIQPYAVQTFGDDRATTAVIYSSIEIAYRDKESRVLSPVLPQTLHQLEFQLVNAIYRMTRPRAPIVAMVAPIIEPNLPPEVLRLYEESGRPVPQPYDPFRLVQQALESENYEVRRVRFDRAEPLPEVYDALLVLSPEGLSGRGQWEIARALAEGRPALVAVQRYVWDYEITRNGLRVRRSDLEPNVAPLLEPVGLGIDTRVLLDEENSPFTINLRGTPQTFSLETHIMVPGEAMNQAHPVTRRLQSLPYVWGTAVTLDGAAVAEAGLALTTLFQSSERSWTAETGEVLRAGDRTPPADPAELHPRPLCVLAEGTWPWVFAGAERPDWPEAAVPATDRPPEEEAPGEPVSAPTRMILLGDAMLFNNQPLESNPDSVSFLLNAVDSLALGETGAKILSLRDKTAKVRTIGRLGEWEATVWKAVHLAGIYVVIALVGVIVWVLRLRGREAYAARLRVQES
jgi:ABC-type transport system involved in multi-copper enzyme maturation permease subunit/ABC-type uncharacterized transport system involved in gliding motility auxiliary subunit